MRLGTRLILIAVVAVNQASTQPRLGLTGAEPFTIDRTVCVSVAGDPRNAGIEVDGQPAHIEEVSATPGRLGIFDVRVSLPEERSSMFVIEDRVSDSQLAIARLPDP